LLINRGILVSLYMSLWKPNLYDAGWFRQLSDHKQETLRWALTDEIDGAYI